MLVANSEVKSYTSGYYNKKLSCCGDRIVIALGQLTITLSMTYVDFISMLETVFQFMFKQLHLMK